MRILHVIATLDRRAGGPATSIRNIVNSYPRLGHEGEIVTLDDPSASYFGNLDCPVHALGPVSTRFGYSPSLVKWLKKEGERFDGIVVHGLWQYLGKSVHQVFYGRKPYMVFTHGMLDPYFKHAFPLKHLKKWLYWILVEYWVLRHAERVLFTSEPEAELAKKSFWIHRWKPQVISYGAIAPDKDPGALCRKFLSQHPSLGDEHGNPKPYLLFLGRIHPKKGCDLLLLAFARVAQSVPSLQLVIAGPAVTGLKEELVLKTIEYGVESRVHWTGMLEGEAKWGALYSCEAFVLPSHQENFGIAVAEALACGKPVLISNKVNIWEPALQDGAAIVAEDDEEGTTELLQRWTSLDTAQRAAMETSASQCFQKRFNMQENVRGLINLFSQLISDRSMDENRRNQKIERPASSSSSIR